jgi:hypothetical protein
LGVPIASAQVVATEPLCRELSKLTVTVFDMTGAVVPKAFAMLRSPAGPAGGKPFELQTIADENGKVAVSFSCGYLDVFATALFFAPSAKRVEIDGETRFVAIRLETYPTRME